MILGTRPQSVAEPSEDGYYWVRLAAPRYVHVPCELSEVPKSYFTWEPPDVSVELVRLKDGMTDWVGSDEGASLQDSDRVLLEIIAKVEEPS